MWLKINIWAKIGKEYFINKTKEAEKNWGFAFLGISAACSNFMLNNRYTRDLEKLFAILSNHTLGNFTSEQSDVLWVSKNFVSCASGI